MTIFIDIHVLQTVPPSNINRDDTGSPKTATFGGTRRARVSSQAWKRAIRADFAKKFDSQELGERTLVIADRVAQVVTEKRPDLADRALDLSVVALKAAGLKVEKKNVTIAPGVKGDQYQTGALLFASRPQIEAVADLIVANPEEKPTKKEAQKALMDGVTIDVALFGRMIADAPELNVDACAQVAHALSVNKTDNEFDYFTAVDDNALETTVGAGMIGNVEFNSSTLYRYVTVNASELAQVLGSVEAATRGVEVFVNSFVTSMPTGKQNTFANRTLPEFVMLTVRDDQPVNLVGAFEDAVSNTEGRVAEATTRLLIREEEIENAYGSEPIIKVAVAIGGAREAVRGSSDLQMVNLDELVQRAGNAVRNYVEV